MNEFDFPLVVTQTPIVFCKDCRYWDCERRGGLTKTPEGLCRRNAPYPISSNAKTQAATSWPHTFEDDWCGEGEARLPD